MYEVRWHGRGGQGAITAAILLAEAAHLYEGFEGVAAAPSFGAERRGAPVIASTRIDSQPILRRSQVTQPDIVVVLDETLLDVVDITKGIRPGGTVVINTARPELASRFNGSLRLGLADASAAAQEMRLVVGGSVIVNTAILGALCRATGIVSIENMLHTIQDRFDGAAGNRNAQAARIAYERTAICEPGGSLCLNGKCH
jgi:2-oxoacid:acceptor oxidoreductase gamma subunit (pyruvate/2-ketoisovalerate family)